MFRGPKRGGEFLVPPTHVRPKRGGGSWSPPLMWDPKERGVPGPAGRADVVARSCHLCQRRLSKSGKRRGLDGARSSMHAGRAHVACTFHLIAYQEHQQEWEEEEAWLRWRCTGRARCSPAVATFHLIAYQEQQQDWEEEEAWLRWSALVHARAGHVARPRSGAVSMWAGPVCRLQVAIKEPMTPDEEEATLRCSVHVGRPVVACRLPSRSL